MAKIARTSQKKLRLPRAEALQRRLLMSVAILPGPAIALGNGTTIFQEHRATEPIDPNLTVTDPRCVLLTGASVQLAGYVPGEDSLGFSNQDRISGSWNSATGILTFTGFATVDQYQAELRSVTYKDSSADPSTVLRSAIFIITDPASSSTPVARAIQVLMLDITRSVSVPATQQILEDTSLVFASSNENAITVADSDANSGIEQVTLVPSNGSLTIANSTPLVFMTANQARVMTLIGTIPALNAALDEMVFTPATHAYGAAAIRVQIDDLGHSGVGGPLTSSGVIPIQITPVAHTPILTSAPVSMGDEPADRVNIAPNPLDDSLPGYFQITGIAGGTLLASTTMGPVNNGQFIPFAQGESGLIFVVTAGAARDGQLEVAASTTASSQGLGGAVIHANLSFPPTRNVTAANPEFAPQVEASFLPNPAPQPPPAWFFVVEQSVDVIALQVGFSIAEAAQTQGRLLPQAASFADAKERKSIADSRFSSPLLPAVMTAAAQPHLGLFAQGRAMANYRLLSRTASSRLGDLAADSVASFAATGMQMLRELDSLRRQITSDVPLRIWAGTAAILTAGGSIGYVLWLTRGGSLLSSVVSSMPAWNVVDPLPILDQMAKSGAAIHQAGEDGLERLVAR